MEDIRHLYAVQARDKLSSPINSNFRVGAFLMTDKNNFQAGNIEHTNSMLNMCADRLVLMLAIGKKATPTQLHLVSDSDSPIYPCGVCRQYMTAFPKLRVTCWSNDGSVSESFTVGQLMPKPYKRNLKVA